MKSGIAALSQNTSLSRFLDKVDKTDSCWIWNAALFKTGYGAFSFKSKPVKAHRYIYEVYNGEIDSTQHVLHSCDNPKCVNPSHLRTGTPKENINDAVDRKRVNHILTDEQILAIRKEYVPFVVSFNMLAAKYGVSKKTIMNVVKKRSWKRVC